MQTSTISPMGKGGASGSPSAIQTHADSRAYEERVNPQWVGLLNLLDLSASHSECRGEELRTHCA